MPRKRTKRCACHAKRPLDNIPSIQAATKRCLCHGSVHLNAGNAAPATSLQAISTAHTQRGPQPSAAPATTVASHLQSAAPVVQNGPPAACSTTFLPSRQLPSAAHATEAYTNAGNAAPATNLQAISTALHLSRKTRPPAERCACHDSCKPCPVTQIGAQPRVRQHRAGTAAPATKFAGRLQKCFACHTKRGPQPRA